MSLRNLLKRPVVRAAFKRLAMSERTPASLRRSPILIPSAGGPRGLAGTTFDYVVRAHLARELRNSTVIVHCETSILDSADKDLAQAYGASSKHWRKLVEDAKKEIIAYTMGNGEARRIAEVGQYISMMDVYYRSGYFDPTFRPNTDVRDEVLRLLDLFDPVIRLSPQRSCVFGPTFYRSNWVNADADLVVDDRLIDLKTTVKPEVSLDALLQLAGYVALQKISGAHARWSEAEPLTSVELYFARYGKLVRWPVSTLFPNNGLQQFCDVLRDELLTVDTGRGMDVPPSIETAINLEFVSAIGSVFGDIPEIAVEPARTCSGENADGARAIILSGDGAVQIDRDKNYIAKLRRLAKKFGYILLRDREQARLILIECRN